MSRAALAVAVFLVACVFGAVAAGRFAAGLYGEGAAIGLTALIFLLIAIATGRAR